MSYLKSVRAAAASPTGVFALATLAIGAAMLVDLPLQRAVGPGRPRGVAHDFFNATEAFGNGFGVAMIVLTIVVLDRFRRVQTSRLLAASLGAGLAADVVKLCVSRTRPHTFDVDSGAVWETFTGLLPLTSAGSAGQSFPSAHTTCAFGLATALALSYPAGRRLFYAFAVGVAAQRVCVNAHYLSDVVAGAFLGVAWAYGVCRVGAMCRGFDRVEGWWSRRFGWPLPAGHGALPTPKTVRVGVAPPAEPRRAA